MNNKNSLDFLTQENLQVACELIQQTVVNDALNKLRRDPVILEELALRNKTNEQKNYHMQTKEWIEENLPEKISY